MSTISHDWDLFLLFIVLLFIAVFVIIYFVSKTAGKVFSMNTDLMGSVKTVMVDETGVARVKHDKQLWQITSQNLLYQGQQVEIVAVADKMLLEVKPIGG